MKCTHVALPGGGHAIVCTSGRTKRCRCGAVATRACDWKVGRTVRGKVRTCDTPLCERCTHVPAEGKDLCRTHAAEWKRRQAAGDGRG